MVERCLHRLERDRVRGDAGRERHLHHHLQHGELRPDGRPHRRLHRRRARPDALRQRVPDAPHGLAEDHPRAGHRGRLQRPALRSIRTASSTTSSRSIRASSRSSALASKATGYPIARVAAKIAVGPAAGRDRERGDAEDARLLRAGARLLRRQRSRAGRSTSSTRRTGASARR